MNPATNDQCSACGRMLGKNVPNAAPPTILSGSNDPGCEVASRDSSNQLNTSEETLRKAQNFVRLVSDKLTTHADHTAAVSSFDEIHSTFAEYRSNHNMLLAIKLALRPSTLELCDVNTLRPPGRESNAITALKLAVEYELEVHAMIAKEKEVTKT